MIQIPYYLQAFFCVLVSLLFLWLCVKFFILMRGIERVLRRVIKKSDEEAEQEEQAKQARQAEQAKLARQARQTELQTRQAELAKKAERKEQLDQLWNSYK
ncbi:MAG: hypothetical protein LBG65_02095 [Puniceicoccales bacterium]|jgi:flagellar biosynthesis/type III secretory pathway M-ring protein FliF/YscJ|nr:hypothetical protein [Puniceicoccales bacterium]